MIVSKICRMPLRISPWNEGRWTSRAEQLVFPLAFVLAAAGLSVSTFSLRKLGVLCSKDRRHS